MCGIAGVYHFRDNQSLTEQELRVVTDTLTHRGPDDSGYYHDGKVQFGFRRLSIVDLKHGQQPLFNEDGSLVLLCNGEIFNYKQLTTELEARGHRFRTRCDVEVILHLYEEMGVRLLDRINGQFAFAVYDRNKETLFIARDHFGVCPLFFLEQNEKFIFASEIKALLKFPGIRRAVNLKGLDQVFTFPGIVSPTTMFDGIGAVKPGHYIVVENNKVTQREYWDLDFPRESDESDLGEDHCLEQLEALLTTSVNQRLHADVPVGLYLSGGLDSSVIGCISKKLHPDVRWKSFSMTFSDSRYDERKFQRIISDHIQSDHFGIEFDPGDIIRRLSDMIYFAEMPLKETYNTCSIALSEAVSRNSIKVILTGEGADEILAGYAGHKFDAHRNTLAKTLDPLEDAFEREVRDTLWGDADFQYEKNLYDFDESKKGLYADGVLEKLSEFSAIAHPVINKDKIRGRSNIHKRSYLDMKLRLSDHLVADHGDRTAYANSIEARYPFLDIDLIRFITTIPSKLKFRNMSEKYLLKKIASKMVPPTIVNREKFGFVAPGSTYVCKKNVGWINDMLSFERIKRQGYFNPFAVEKLKTEYQKNNFFLHETYETDLLMIILTFGLFLDLFQMPDHS
jgi:asparagine synthase (glutamine-hydrolysing)